MCESENSKNSSPVIGTSIAARVSTSCKGLEYFRVSEKQNEGLTRETKMALFLIHYVLKIRRPFRSPDLALLCIENNFSSPNE